MEHIQQLETELQQARSHYEEFSGKRTGKSATASRASLLKMKKISDNLRKEILKESKEVKETRKATKKSKKTEEPETKKSKKTEEPKTKKSKKTEEPKTKK